MAPVDETAARRVTNVRFLLIYETHRTRNLINNAICERFQCNINKKHRELTDCDNFMLRDNLVLHRFE